MNRSTRSMLATGVATAAALGAISVRAATPPVGPLPLILAPVVKIVPLAGGLLHISSAPLAGVAGPSSAASTAPHATGNAAPSGSSSAQGLSIPPLGICVSCTSANAGPSGSAAKAQALRVLGHDVSTGGSTANGAGDGALLALPENPLLGLMVADWATMAVKSETSSSAHARSALADLTLADGRIATVAVLEAQSDASWTHARSHGSAFTNGMDANVGQGALVVILLHSETRSDGSGETYVASINGTELLAMSNGQGIPVVIPGVATINLLSTSAAGGDMASAAGATASQVLGSAGTQGVVLGAQGSGAQTAPAGDVSAASAGSATKGGTAAARQAAAVAAIEQAVSAPSTGAHIALGGLGLLLAGFGLAGVASRRRTA